jgi:pyrimidine-nucleoside phosphorylase
MNYLPSEIIRKKRNKLALTEEEILFFINGYTSGAIPDYQMSALLMAIYFNGMNDQETLSLTKTMLHSGVVVQHEKVKTFKVDKHSTGGVGDKTSLILGPIVAALGVAVPMISGRGLGHTGGTLDKLESIPGFNTQLTLEKFKSMVEEIGVSFIGQTQDICPADKKIYALRDVTCTVESLPLICASIMSKKLAEGIDGLVLDVKFGSGAFMKTQQLAEELATHLLKIARGYGKKATALLTNMNQPLGRYAGNSLEIFECLEILKGQKCLNHDGKDRYEDTRELSLQLSAHMLYLASYKPDLKSCYEAAKTCLDDGRALKKFEELIKAHGGRLEELPIKSLSLNILSEQEGYIQSFNTETLGVAGIKLKAGRSQTTDIIEPTAGIEFYKKVGDFVKKGEVLFTVFGQKQNDLESVKSDLIQAVNISTTQPVEVSPLIWKIL